MQDVRAANVKALTDGALLALHRDDFNALLGSLTHIRHMWRFEALRKVSSQTIITMHYTLQPAPACPACQASPFLSSLLGVIAPLTWQIQPACALICC